MCRKSKFLRFVMRIPRFTAYGAWLALAAVCQYAQIEAASNPLTASETHGLVLNSDGTACAAGQNNYGELGDGTVVDRSVFVQALIDSANHVSTGWRHTLAVKADGTVWAWGYNGYGELGDGTTVDKPTPIQVPGLSGIVAVAAGAYHSLALQSNGTVWAWGYNNEGELGDGTNTQRNAPVPVTGLGSVTALAAGEYHSLALKSDGSVSAWGYNGYGQLGDGTNTNRLRPVPVANFGSAVAIAAGANHSLALQNNGEVWGWGFNGYGQLGDGSTASSNTIVRASNLTNIVSIAGGDYHSAAVRSDGTAWTWGYNGSGELGDGTQIERITPVQVSNLTSAVAIAAGSYYTFALRSNGSIEAWGDNTNGQLGNGTTTSSLLPVTSSPCNLGASPETQRSPLIGRIAASQNFSLAAENGGGVESWGQNPYGQLGNGTTVSSTSPVQAALSEATQVSAGWRHGLAAKSDGTVSSWGYNGYGELGDGTTSDKITPITVPGLGGVSSVAAGGYHSLALESNGNVVAWGYNGNGELGDGTTAERNNPVAVINLTNVIAIAAGENHSLALRRDGTVWAWGYNGYGQLGDGSTTSRTSAVQVLGLSNVVSIAAGANHSLALKSDGTVWTWGFGGYGQLGYGSTASTTRPVRASELTDIIAIAGGDYHSLAVRSDGTVWAWGYNGNGQLGIGNTTEQLTPVQATGLTNVLAVAAGDAHSLALKSDGTIVAWGNNQYGQFGNGTTNSSTVPIGAVPAIGPTYRLALNVSPSGSGTVSASPASASGTYLAGLKVCLSPSPANDYQFTGWSGGTVGSDSCIIMNANYSLTADFAAASSLRFIPVTPCRIADTRNPTGPFGAPAITGGTSRNFPIPSSACSIPANAAAYSLNVTAVPGPSLNYLTVWPEGQKQPVVSTLNSLDGRVKANAAIVPAGTNGAISVFASDTTNVILDIDGYFVPSNEANTLAFYPLAPCRITDTRNSSGPLGGPYLSGGQQRAFPVLSSSCQIPQSAQAYSLNVTAIPRHDLGYLTVWPDGNSKPLVSTLNAPTGAITANAAIVRAGVLGEIDVFATDDTDLIIDVNGYFAAPSSGGLSLYNVTPCRVLDTRALPSSEPIDGTIGVNVSGSVCAAPASAKAFVLNATVIPPSSLVYLTLWPDNHTKPVVSTLNAVDGAITSNMAIVPTSNGLIDAFGSDPTQLIIDISGYFAP